MLLNTGHGTSQSKWFQKLFFYALQWMKWSSLWKWHSTKAENNPSSSLSSSSSKRLVPLNRLMKSQQKIENIREITEITKRIIRMVEGLKEKLHLLKRARWSAKSVKQNVKRCSLWYRHIAMSLNIFI